MNQLLLILGVTILYYVVLFWLDQRGRKAFKAKQQALIAKTTELPIIENTIEPAADFLGTSTNLAIEEAADGIEGYFDSIQTLTFIMAGIIALLGSIRVFMVRLVTL